MRFVVVATLAALCAVPPACETASAGVEELTIGGRLMWDQVVWGAVDDGLGLAAENGTEVRRARICAGGRVYSNLGFKVEWDFSNGEEVCLKDAYMELTGVPALGAVRVGHMYEPFCMNELTSSKYISFMERASLTTFAPSHNSGLMWLGNAGDRVRWQTGAFRTTDGIAGASGDRGVSAACRVALLAAGQESGERLLHMGGAVNYLMPEGDSVRFRARPEVHMSDRLVDTGELNAESVLRVGAELAAVLGPLHIAGEYVMAGVSGNADSSAVRSSDGDDYDASFTGYYVQAGYFMTGEHRNFSDGRWQRVKPRANFLEDGGAGAWEIAVRYSGLDLNDSEACIEGGTMDGVTLGLNWYMHSNARVMLNQVWSSVSDSDGDDVGSASATMIRYQFDF